MADVRRCVEGHPAAERDTSCRMCGAELVALEPSTDSPTSDRRGEIAASGSGWPHIALGAGIMVVSGLAITFSLSLGFPVVTVILAGVGLLGLANLIIGSVAQGIKVAEVGRR